MPEWLQALIAAIRGRQATQPVPVEPQPGQPMLSDVVNPARALNRRMAAEGEAAPVLPDVKGMPVPAGQPARFGRQFTEAERKAQAEQLARILAARQMSQ